MALVCLTVSAQEENNNESLLWTSDRPDGHAPISVMGDHTHKKGDWMFSYRYMDMNMKQLGNGKNDISNLSAHNKDYMVTPIDMQMKMHMFGVMYATLDRLTLMLMVNSVENTMNLQMRMMSGMTTPFSTKSNGFGDIKISGMYKLFNKNRQSMHAQFGVSIPTGSIDSKDVTPMSMGNKVILPYPMQIGSGTLDSNLGLTYLGQSDLISWGNQLKGTLRFGKNDTNYRLGNQYRLNNWLAIKVTNWLSFSARLEGVIVGEIEGVNSDLNPMMVTTADTDNSGGMYINSGLGFNTYISKGSFKNVRFGFEIEFPVCQKVNGIQLKQKETFTFGLQYSL